MDTQKLCLKIEQAIRMLTPLSVTLVESDGRLATFRIVAEAFSGMKLPTRIQTMLACLDAFDTSILKSFDLDFELLSPAESAAWGAGASGDDQKSSSTEKAAARDADI